MKRHINTPRTPTFASFKRLLQRAAASSRYHPNRAVTDQSRRRFLQFAAIGTTALWSGVPLYAASHGTPKVAIVGAGLAGLSAAYQLKKAGIQAAIYEATGRTGGRVYTVEHAIGRGLTSDLGGSFINSDHTQLLTLAEELEVELLDLEEDPDDLAEQIYWFNGERYSDEEIIEAVTPFVPRITKDYQAYRSDPAEATRLDQLSISDYMTQIGMTGWVRDYLSTLFKAEMGLASEEQSALTFIVQLAPVHDGETTMFDLHDERYLVKGGAQRLPDALAAQLDSQIHPYHALQAIRSAGSGYLLTFSGGKEVKADIVILALPFSVLRHVDLQVALPAPKRKAIEELGYGNHAKIAAGFQEKIWRKRGYYGDVLSDKPWQYCWDSTPFQTAPGGGLTFFFGGDESFTVLEQFHPTLQPMLHDLETLFPGLSSAYTGRYVFWSWPTWAYSQGSYSCYRPGQMTTLKKEAGRSVGTLFFAGEHCSEAFNGLMNGAVESGQRAADEVLALLKP